MIRRLTISDFDILIDLWKRANLEFKPYGRDSYSSINFQMQNNPDMYWGFFADEMLVASIVLTDDGRKGWINRIAVDPKFRHQGIAKKLLDFAQDHFLGKGIKIISALVYSSNVPSLELFRKKGYEKCEDILYLRKRLDLGI